MIHYGEFGPSWLERLIDRVIDWWIGRTPDRDLRWSLGPVKTTSIDKK